MKFSLLIAMLEEGLEEEAREVAKDAGASGVTVLHGTGTGVEEKKTFFGLSYEGPQTILVYVLEKRISLKVLKALTNKCLGKNKGVAFSIPIEHLSGIDLKQIELFSEEIRNDI